VSDYLPDDLPSVRIPPATARPVPDEAWRQALSTADVRVTLMLRLAAEAGLRRAEVAQVHTSDVIDSLSGPQLVVHGKGGKTRVVPISDSLAAVLRLGAPGHTPGMLTPGWLFPTGLCGHLTAQHVGVLVARELPGLWTMHKLRHRFATRAYRGSRNLRAVQTLLGHASVATTERYTAVDDAEIRAAMEAAGTG
jgi:integrase/recombinase XerC